MILGSSGLEEAGGGSRQGFVVIANTNEDSSMSGHMEMYFADKVTPNWQVGATFR